MTPEQQQGYDELKKLYEEIQAEVARTRQHFADAEARHKLDLLLVEAGATDLDSARLFTQALAAKVDAPDPQAAVAQAKSRIPSLFKPAEPRATQPSFGGAMAPKHRLAQPPPLEAAQDAAATGKRTDLLRYMRLRRKQKN